MAPKHSGSVAVDYTVPLEFGTLAFHGDWVRSSKYFVGAPQIYQTNVVNGVATPQIRFSDGSSTDRFNASVSLRDVEVGGRSMEVRLWIKNIFNHADRAFTFPGATVSPLTPQPASAIYVQPPRTFGAEVTVDF
jgi:outer membrane receptor protein involved in Fe transport